MHVLRVVIVLAIAACGSERSIPRATSPTPEPSPPQIKIRRLEAMIPMRDGIKLNTQIYIPEVGGGPHPIVFRRTPYEAPSSDEVAQSPQLQKQPWVKRGTMLAMQDIRGRFRSEGSFVMLRPPRDASDPKAIDETTDAYDTIEWLVRNVPNNNGRVGMAGTSYDGWVITAALLEPHPALSLAIVEGTPADTFLGDDFLHNGSLRRTSAFEYVAMMETDPNKVTPFRYGTQPSPGDAYAYHLGLGPPSQVTKTVFAPTKPEVRPTWSDLSRHPTHDEFWQRRNLTTRFTTPKVPTLHVSGWYDVEDFYGSVANYLAFERLDRDRRNQLIIGPWRHGGWHSVEPKLGVFDFGAENMKKYAVLRTAMIERHLYGAGAGDDTEAWVFETGSNQWRSFAQFPPPSRPHKLYFAANGALSTAPPKADGADEYTSDPARPVPHAARPQGPFWEFTDEGLSPQYGMWRVADQRFASDRPDVAQWVSAPLETDLTAAGALTAHLFASTTGTDSDFVVRVIDVFPDDAGALAGYQLLVAAEIQPARFRDGPTRAVATIPGKPFAIDVDLRWLAHRFAKGHRIMVAVQSTWFPLHERNPQTLVDPFTATASDYRVATQRILRSPRYPSHVELPVIETPAN